MTRYIAFLGGINVGSHRVKMEDLRRLFFELGCKNVGTYIASGNVFFDSNETDTIAFEQHIERALESSLGFTVPVFVRTVGEVEALLKDAPFNDRTPKADKRFCVLFLSEQPETKLKLPIQSSKNDMEIIAQGDKALFIEWRIINGRPPSGSFPKNLLSSKCTSRFFHTLVKIAAAAKV